ncbi:hypothetical protein ACWGB8_11170 [Kitasatospora sp. NPDC054939]
MAHGIDRRWLEAMERRRLSLQTLDGGRCVVVCLDSGGRGGIEVARATRSPYGRGWTVTVRRRLQDAGIGLREYADIHDLDTAIESILTMVAYDDILRDREQSSGTVITYTAVMGTARAQWLADFEQPPGITHLGNGRVRLAESAVAFLQAAPSSYWLLLTVDPDLTRLVIDGDFYPLTRER